MGILRDAWGVLRDTYCSGGFKNFGSPPPSFFFLRGGGEGGWGRRGLSRGILPLCREKKVTPTSETSGYGFRDASIAPRASSKARLLSEPTVNAKPWDVPPYTNSPY